MCDAFLKVLTSIYDSGQQSAFSRFPSDKSNPDRRCCLRLIAESLFRNLMPIVHAYAKPSQTLFLTTGALY
jgi:hypothetical protein